MTYSDHRPNNTSMIQIDIQFWCRYNKLLINLLFHFSSLICILFIIVGIVFVLSNILLSIIPHFSVLNCCVFYVNCEFTYRLENKIMKFRWSIISRLSPKIYFRKLSSFSRFLYCAARQVESSGKLAWILLFVIVISARLMGRPCWYGPASKERWHLACYIVRFANEESAVKSAEPGLLFLSPSSSDQRDTNSYV